ncbi:MAG: MiaB/RimO family radical SAM methylthiotransferase [Candidatus Thermoplasmatota archaeon]|jgi:MiaB/RimO family radical SAM methylthiotransferase|nr:MiaB/RimO family radical SAM methylthiotransferase [Candidatus Thermoplasmatota archaeon]MCL5788907.1 MiaB/RimO family radical SAM methylthiotransferase [Candidatus Thermoplasmatota archaeon]
MKFYLENYGCTLNQAQGEMIANSLISQGNQLVEDVESADSVLISTCVVIKHTEDRMLRRIEQVRNQGKDVIVSGCLTNVPEDVKRLDFSVSYGKLPILKDGNLSAGVPIAEGCDGGCTFCISRIARGRLKSFNEDDIVRSVRELVNRGAKEIRLTALDTGSYGQDSSTSLPALVSRIAGIDGDFKIRIGMMEPENAGSIIDDLLGVMRSGKVYKFLHIPFQSGDQVVLRKMGRQYRIERFLEVVRKFRAEFPAGMLSTDVIVGFPNETVEGLRETARVIREVRPEILNVTRYSPRPGTAAYSWKTPPSNQTAQWSQIFSELHRDISVDSLKRFVGIEEEVLITETGKNRTVVGRDENYHPVVLKSGRLGERRIVKIFDSSKFYLLGR